MSYSHSSTSPSAPPLPESASAWGQQQFQPPPNYYAQSQYGSGYDPEVIRSFQFVDRDRSGFIDENELQQALSNRYQRFSMRTVKLLMFLFKNPHDSLRIGPKEFAEVWSCIGQWRGMFESFDRDRSGKIDAMELKDAFYSLGYAIPPSVLQVLISRYDNGTGQKTELTFDNFIECGMIVKGLTEKFKEKDPRYTGSATLTYNTFMCMLIPFLV